MGACLSSQAGEEKQTSLSASQPARLDNVAVYPPAAALGLTATVSQCGWVEAGCQTTTRGAVLRRGHSTLLLALFEGVGPRPAAAACAAWAAGAVGPAFDECLRRHTGDVPAALRATFSHMDGLLAAADGVSHAAKAEGGAVGALVHLDVEERKLHVASLGDTALLLCRVLGSFNSRQAEGFLLTKSHTAASAEERVRQHRRAGSLSGYGEEAQQAGAGRVTRALGLLAAKRQRASGADLIAAEADVASHTLTASDQHLVLGTAAVWEDMAPSDAALRMYCCEKLIQSEKTRVAAATATGSASPTALPRNPAEDLTRYLVAKRAQRLARDAAAEAATGAAQQLQQEQEGGEAGGGEPGRLAPASSAVAAPASAVLVVSLQWPSKGCEFPGDGLLAAVIGRQAARASYLERLGQRRWRLLMSEVEFRRLRRRRLLRLWWEAVDAALKRHRVMVCTLGGGSPAKAGQRHQSGPTARRVSGSPVKAQQRSAREEGWRVPAARSR